jgi:hypothetical protein
MPSVDELACPLPAALNRLSAPSEGPLAMDPDRADELFAPRRAYARFTRVEGENKVPGSTFRSRSGGP